MNLTFMIKYIMEVNMPNLNLNDNEIKRLHDAGLSAANIAIVMKCSKTTILNHLRKMNNK